MSKVQRTRGSGRLSERQMRFIQKVAATGREHPEQRKLYVFLLITVLLCFYLLSYCRKKAAVSIIVLCVGLTVISLFVAYKFGGTKGEEVSDKDLQMLQRQQESLLALRNEVYNGADPGEQEEAFISALMEENADIVGWLTIPGTEIDYPVMQTPEEEDYYLYRDFYGNENQNGSLLVSAECDLENENTNWIIHGHNMRSGAMFAGLLKYQRKSYMRDHRLIFLDTLDGKRTYEVIAVFESQVYRKDDYVFKYYQCYDIESWEEFDSFYNNIKGLSLYDTGVEAVYGDRFLILSTCAYHTENGRFVVVGKELY